MQLVMRCWTSCKETERRYKLQSGYPVCLVVYGSNKLEERMQLRLEVIKSLRRKVPGQNLLPQKSCKECHDGMSG